MISDKREYIPNSCVQHCATAIGYGIISVDMMYLYRAVNFREFGEFSVNSLRSLARGRYAQQRKLNIHELFKRLCV